MDSVFRPPPKPPWLYWACFHLAWMVFAEMPQQRFKFLDKKGLVGSRGVVDTNICNHFLVQFASNQVFNFDIFEITYSRNELAAVSYLIRNWIEKKIVDYLPLLENDPFQTEFRTDLRRNSHEFRTEYYIDTDFGRNDSCPKKPRG
jgi:hypothetical protein